MSTASWRWHETCQLFHELCDLSASARADRLAAVGTTDPALKEAVESLLDGDEAADERLARLELGITDVLQRERHTASPPMDDPLQLVGRSVSHFRVVAVVGCGGMGVVYRAEDTRLGREVALKLPLRAQRLDARGRARFLREARAAGSLDHPNLCGVYEVGESESGEPYLAMPLHAGEPLRSRLARDGVLPVVDALDIARQIALGLAFAHGAGVVHRDLKPGNVMLLPDGTVKILDFGLAKLTDLSQSASGTGLGTAGYMAPEQVRGSDVDARADQWSLGVLLYEMLAGVRPFRGDDALSIAHAILHDDVAPPSALRPELAPAVDEVVLALLQKDPARRLASAREVAADLDAIQRGATPPFRRRLPPRATRWLRTRTPRARAALATLVVGGVVAVGMTGYALLSPGRGALTRNAEAHTLYLRAGSYEQRNAVVAETLYRRALALDPQFAQARARLALVHLAYTLRPVEARLEVGRQEATAALRTQPGLPDAHFALGLYWQRREDHERALVEFARARRGLRHSSALDAAIGSSYRSLGRWEEAVTALERALELDPHNIAAAPALALTYGRLRRYRESTGVWERYIALTPDAYFAMLIRGYQYIRWTGTSDTLAAALRRIPPEWDERGMTTFARVSVARLQRRPADQLAALDASRHTVSEDDMLYRPHSLLRAGAYEALGDSRRALAHYDSARQSLQDSVAAHPLDPRLHIALGMALAGLGQRDDAIGAARRAMALAPLSASVPFATGYMGGTAEIYAYLDEADAALQLLEQLLQMPAGREASVPLLRVDPAYDRLRDDPRFDRLLERYAPK